jgi:CMP-N,N'-diacetyllegionaminic acid synthase
MKEIITIIPARGGSKGVPRKNLKILDGKPLIAHSILDAQEARKVNQVYVSTDDPEIAAVSHEYGAEVIVRPSELATDTASSEVALLHAILELEKAGIFPDAIVFLQCTSPIRTGEDIDNAIAQFQTEKADSLLSVSPSHRFLWEQVNGEATSINYDYRHRPRRQDMKPQFMENGSIYIFKPWVIKELNNRLGGKISLFVMGEQSSLEIDTLTDFAIIDTLFQEQKI